VSQVNPNLKISIGRIFPIFPPGIKLSIVHITYFGDSILDADDMIITPRLLSFLSQKRSVLFQVDAHGGIVKGKVDVAGKNTNQQVFMDANITGIQLANVTALKSQLPFNLSGILDANIDYKNSPESGDVILAKLELSDCEVEISAPFLNQNSFYFEHVEAELLINNKIIKINRCHLQGEQIDAMISGSGILKQPLKKSIIDLSGTLRLQQSFLSEMKNDSDKSIFNQIISDRGKISFKINGSINNPGFSLK
jgi:type II secretion system protein N